jgi:hypothetical protein
MNPKQPELSKRINNKIEALCEEGCSQVNKLLLKAENGNKIDELSNFKSEEIDQIIDELSQIMSTYNNEDTTT